MQIRVNMPGDKESQRLALELIAKHRTLDQAIESANLPFTKGTLSDISKGRWENLSPEKVNAFRTAMNLDPLPDTQEVTERIERSYQKALATVLKPRPKRNTTPRYHPPKDPRKMAEYLNERMSVDDLETLRFELLQLHIQRYI